VLHAGIYYPYQSLKAILCVKSVLMMKKYLLERKIPVHQCGKLIVATTSDELLTLQNLFHKAQKNGVNLIEKISQQDAQSLEPEVSCVGALWSPSTSIFDTHSFMTSLLCEGEENGANYVFNCEVMSVQYQPSRPQFVVRTNQGDIETDIFINACGHSAPHIHYEFPKGSIHFLQDRSPTPHFLKGTYFKYHGGQLFQRLVYPLPHQTGALGIHATIDLNGITKFGPDAVWIHPPDSKITHADYQVDDSRQELFEAAIRRYYPNLPSHSISPDYSGIRPRLLGPEHSGSSIDQFGRDLTDFVIDGPRHHQVDGLVNLYGIESPGLTCSLAIADYVYDLIRER
jgi:L-2-hydroxyglutarate oxidase LhgO